MPSLTLPNPFGPLTITEANGVLTTLDWRAGHNDPSPLLHEAATQLAQYFAGTRQKFDLPLDAGHGLQAQVRSAMLAIPFGQTRTYGDLARALQTNAQAVGQACGANPLPILIPCHRILAANGLGGFSAKGGIEMKVALLRLEGAASLLL